MRTTTHLDVPFAAVLVVVVLVVLLDGHVREVDEGVVHLPHLAVVLGGTEPAGRANRKIAVGKLDETGQG